MELAVKITACPPGRKKKSRLNDYHTLHIFQTWLLEEFTGWVSPMDCTDCLRKRMGFNIYTQITLMRKTGLYVKVGREWQEETNQWWGYGFHTGPLAILWRTTVGLLPLINHPLTYRRYPREHRWHPEPQGSQQNLQILPRKTTMQTPTYHTFISSFLWGKKWQDMKMRTCHIRCFPETIVWLVVTRAGSNQTA